ncbi:hypothetical protein M5K25_020781 [Dendrobium thyrsiflorum]|uniref:Uncharacterized protein n=1 Tax=Dendrobium thyrsiflorum TaxID=117978 RepID=A0ABD0UAZ7_DENTH
MPFMLHRIAPHCWLSSFPPQLSRYCCCQLLHHRLLWLPSLSQPSSCESRTWCPILSISSRSLYL